MQMNTTQTMTLVLIFLVVAGCMSRALTASGPFSRGGGLVISLVVSALGIIGLLSLGVSHPQVRRDVPPFAPSIIDSLTLPYAALVISILIAPIILIVAKLCANFTRKQPHELKHRPNERQQRNGKDGRFRRNAAVKAPDISKNARARDVNRIDRSGS